jgi:hypothetical protein
MTGAEGAPPASPAASGAPRDHAAMPVKPRPLRIALYVLLVLSAAAALFLEPALAGAIARGAISPLWLFTGIGIYGLFFAVYVVDRLMLVKFRRYPPGRAFFQIAFGSVLALVLLPSTIRDYAARPAGHQRLLAHPDPEIRQIAVEALLLRGPTRDNVSHALERRRDRDPRVREAATRVLSRWSGRAEEDTAGIESWATALSATATATEERR